MNGKIMIRRITIKIKIRGILKEIGTRIGEIKIRTVIDTFSL